MEKCTENVILKFVVSSSGVNMYNNPSCCVPGLREAGLVFFTLISTFTISCDVIAHALP